MAVRFISPADGPVRRPDVLIVGSGVAGLATAFFASRQGLRVLLLERMLAPASLTSRRSGEGVRAQWGLAHNIEMARASIDLYARFGEVLGDNRMDAGLRRRGYLYASRTPAGSAALAARVEAQRSAGLDDVVYMDGGDVTERFPLVAPDVMGGAFRAGDGTVDVDRIIEGYLSAAAADVLLGCEALRLVPRKGGVAVETTAGTIEGGAAVIANGAAAFRLLAGFEGAPPLRTAKSTIMRIKVDGIPADAPAIIDIDEGSFWRPDEGGGRITASFRGLRLVDDGVDDPHPESGYLDRAIATAAPMTPLWAELAPRIRDSHLRTGTFAVTADGAPVIGPLPGAAGIYVNIGYGGHGVMMSPEGARRLVERLGGKPHDPADPFAAERFLGGRVPTPEPMTINLADHLRPTAFQE